MLCFPNCKINIGLFITSKRADGYHNLETVFYPIPFHDVLEIIPTTEPTSLKLTGLPIAGDWQQNLVYKAYELLRSLYPHKVPFFQICMHKVIPMGAGIGGGSADAAYMLQLLNNYCHLELTQQELAQHAATLGSDCAFFIYDKPCYASGRGEVLEPIQLDLSPYSVQLICPEVHVSTKEAFGNIQPKEAPFQLTELGSLPIADWQAQIYNHFEATVFPLYPALAHIKEQLLQQGAIYAAMSGSGSALYGIFPKNNRATISSSIAFKDIYILNP